MQSKLAPAAINEFNAKKGKKKKGGKYSAILSGKSTKTLYQIFQNFYQKGTAERLS